jgi:ubiquitin C-terminal hydrolase
MHKSVKYLQKYDESENAGSSPTVNKTASSTVLSSSSSSASISSNNQTQTTASSATLNDCFELFTEREHLTDENSWMCPKCQKQTNAYKKLCISSVPPILIIHLKRFFYKSKTSNFKLTTPVWFPINGLNIRKYLDKSAKSKSNNQFENNSNIDDEANDDDDDNDIEDNSENSSDYNMDESYMYDLFAVANHKGQNMANGHYTGIWSFIGL